MIPLHIVAFVLLSALEPSRTQDAEFVGQGTRSDYERAIAWPSTTRNLVYRDQVRPEWDASGNTFWYRIETSRDTAEFIAVDAIAETRQRAFDHVQLAEALSEQAQEGVEPDRLPFRTIELDEEASTVQFRSFGKDWIYNNVTEELVQANDGVVTRSGLTPLTVLVPSRTSDRDTEIQFRNETEETIELYWISESGRRLSYGSLEPGQDRKQHTFAGHVWLILDQEGKPLAAFRATRSPALAVVNEESTAPRIVTPRSRPNRQRRSEVSPDGRWRAEIVDHNIVLHDMENSAEAVPLSTNGTPENSYRGPLYWSPDSTKLVVMQVEPGENRQIHIIESSPDDQLQPKLITLDYTKPGDRIDHPHPRLFDLESKTSIPIKDELFSNPWRLSRLRWSLDSTNFTFLYNERGHQILRIVQVDTATGTSRCIVDEHSPTFIDYAHKTYMNWIDATDELIWMSERDGWNHLYLIDGSTGDLKNQITEGEWVVRDIVRVDEEKRQIWFSTGGIYPDQDPYYKHLVRVNFDGTGLTILTEGDGTHSWEFSPNGDFFIDTWSRVDHAPIIELRNTASGTLVVPLERADWSALKETGWKSPIPFVAAGRDDTTEIHGIIVVPSHYDPSKCYPVIEKIYAGPQSSYVPKSFGRVGDMARLAELGFIVVQIDGMGTSNRSKAFHDVCWQNLGDAGFPDRIKWIKAAAEEYPAMDLTRVGIYGGSAGGQNALQGLLMHGDFYRVGVADCGCHDNRMDKIWWNELWMGWPIGSHYEAQSNVTQAHRLQGKLMLIVGELDRNVDPASTMQVVDALIKADKDFDFVIIPGAGHGAAGTPYGRRRQLDFFVRHLLEVEPRWEPTE